MKNARWGVVALAAALTAPAAFAQGDAAAGRVKANTCMGCHGIPKYNNAYPTYRVPMLGGQSAGYIEAALKGYRSGERSHPTMAAQASTLSDADIADIAAFLSTAPAK
ncbi:MAG: c-type cytochrome [Nevskiales bacterium]|nr:c-type cytochrome [Nevskiales bacterium]